MQDLKLHENIQAYLATQYSVWQQEIKPAMVGYANEVYGELYYYSIVKLLRYLNITAKDHFLDLGSGLGKIVFQIFFTTDAASVLGVEINPHRFNIAVKVKDQVMQTLPELFKDHRKLDFLLGDFLKLSWNNITVIYICNTVFSVELLQAIATKINNIDSVQKIVSFRKLPVINNFRLIKKIFLHATWDQAICYLYARN